MASCQSLLRNGKTKKLDEGDPEETGEGNDGEKKKWSWEFALQESANLGFTEVQFGKMTLAELKRHTKSYNDEFKDKWQRAAWIVMHTLSPYVQKGQSLTMEKLLPVELLSKKQVKFKTKKDWEAHKKLLIKKAKWLGSVHRRMLKGKMESVPVGGGQLIARHSRKI